MNEHPILFSGPMVRAILEGRKTQTRRVIKFPRENSLRSQHADHASFQTVYPAPLGGFIFWDWKTSQEFSDRAYASRDDGIRCPYGQPGDRLWVRETWRAEELESGLDGVRYKADNAFRPIENTIEASDAWGDASTNKHGVRYGSAWRPSIFMPRWASRLTLEVVSVRVERVQDISEQDAWAEGIEHIACDLPYSGDDLGRAAFSGLWESINGPRGFGWHVNPWVWVVEFKVA